MKTICLNQSWNLQKSVKTKETRAGDVRFNQLHTYAL